MLGYKTFFWAEVCKTVAPTNNSVLKEYIFPRKMKIAVLKGKVSCSELGQGRRISIIQENYHHLKGLRKGVWRLLKFSKENYSAAWEDADVDTESENFGARRTLFSCSKRNQRVQTSLVFFLFLFLRQHPPLIFFHFLSEYHSFRVIYIAGLYHY